MKSQGHGLLLILLVSFLEFGRGEQYSVTVSPTETIDEDEVCRKMVTVSGHGVEDTIPVECKMATYVVANDVQLVVGDKMYSDEDNKLMVLGPSGCEQRTYKNGKMDDLKELTDDECEDVKLSMMRAYMKETGQDDDWTPSSDSSDSSSDLSEGQIKAYDDLREWVTEYLDSDSNSHSKEASKDDNEDQSSFW